ncbi:MAG TPA: hypothetical protein VHG09_03445 [Longimicrobiales bacterium]|nr:hypothetical protein [Longimicrobiales bacterium]
MPRASDTIAAEANRLYWESDTSVAEIAQQLELSRRALYDSVDPLPTNASCEVCGTPLVFENRSARNAGVETCPACTAEEEEADTPAAIPVAKRSRREEDEVQRAVRMGGAALAGAALGAAATLFLVPRR